MQRIAYHVVASSLTFMLLFAGVEFWRMGARLGADSTPERVAPRHGESWRSGCGKRRAARPEMRSAPSSTRYRFSLVSKGEVARAGTVSAVETVYRADDGREVTHRVERFASPERLAFALESHVASASFPIESRPSYDAAGEERGRRLMLFYGVPEVERNWFEFAWTEDGRTLETIEGPTYVHASQFDRALQAGELR